MFRLIVLGGVAYMAWRVILENGRHEPEGEPVLLPPPRAMPREVRRRAM